VYRWGIAFGRERGKKGDYIFVSLEFYQAGNDRNNQLSFLLILPTRWWHEYNQIRFLRRIHMWRCRQRLAIVYNLKTNVGMRALLSIFWYDLWFWNWAAMRPSHYLQSIAREWVRLSPSSFVMGLGLRQYRSNVSRVFSWDGCRLWRSADIIGHSGNCGSPECITNRVRKELLLYALQ